MGVNAQTSVPAFTAGQVLTAAQMTEVNTGIPVFATTTTRDAAFDGTGEKVLAQGQYAYIEATSTLQVYTGSAWVVVGDGLSLIKAQTIGSAVSSVTVSDVFSSSFDAYKVVISSGVGSSNNAQLFLTLGATASGYEWGYVLANTGAVVGSSTTTGTYVPVGEINTSILQGSFEIINPNLAKNSYFNATLGWNLVNFNSRAGLTGVLKDTTAYTAFTLTAGSGTLTGGTIRVYGYKN